MVSARTIGGWASGLCLLLGTIGETTAGDATAADAIYAAPSTDEVRSRALEWAAARKSGDADVLEQVARQWAQVSDGTPARTLLETVIATFCLADAETREFVESCALRQPPLVPPEPAVLERPGNDEFYQANMRLFYGRYLAQRTMYEEALQVLGEIDPKSVVDPASCLFHLAVCQHELLMKEEGLATLDKLLKNTEHVPVSYASVAGLMQYELQNLQEDTLDEVAKMMKDVERRLDLGRGGQKVQKREYEVIAKLDEIIEKLESQAGS